MIVSYLLETVTLSGRLDPHLAMAESALAGEHHPKESEASECVSSLRL